MEWTPEIGPHNGGLRLLRALLLVGAVIWAAAWAFLPVSFSELGTTANCGLGVFAASDQGAGETSQMCSHLAAQHLLIAGVGFLVLMMLGGAVGLSALGEERRYERLVRAARGVGQEHFVRPQRRLRWLRWVVALVVVVALVTELLIVLLHHPAADSATAEPPQPAPQDAAASAVQDAPVRSGLGYGPLTIGMSFHQAAATGDVSGSMPDFTQPCEWTPIAGTGNDISNGGNLLWNQDETLSTIVFGPSMATSKGIRIGSTYQQVHAAYGGDPSYKELVPMRQRVDVRVNLASGVGYKIRMNTAALVDRIELTDGACEV